VKLLTNLQILGCELHKNAFGGRALPSARTRWAGYSAHQTPLAVIKKEGREGKGRKGCEYGEDRGGGKGRM